SAWKIMGKPPPDNLARPTSWPLVIRRYLAVSDLFRCRTTNRTVLELKCRQLRKKGICQMRSMNVIRWAFSIAVFSLYSSASVGLGQPKDSIDKDYAAELPRIAPTEPKDALKTLHVAAGFQVEQVAAEPLVASPVAIAFDESYRLYVVEMRGYSESK